MRILVSLRYRYSRPVSLRGEPGHTDPSSLSRGAKYFLTSGGMALRAAELSARPPRHRHRLELKIRVRTLLAV